MKKVAVIMGSDSDLPVLKGAFEQLKKLGAFAGMADTSQITLF